MFTTTTTTRPVAIHASSKVTAKDLLPAIYGGTVRFSKVRASGTERHWPVYAPGSKERTLGDSILAARAKKTPVEAIAKSLSVSVPTVRRHITAMAFTMEVEALKASEKTALAKVINALATEAPKEPVATKAAPKPTTKATPKASKPAAPKEGSATAKALAAKAKKAEQAAKAPVKADKSHTN